MMRVTSAAQCVGISLALSAFTIAMPCGNLLAATQAAFVQQGTAGFVVSHIEYALSKDAKDTGACPAGMTKGNASLDTSVDGKPLEGAAAEAAQNRLIGELIKKNACGNPTADAPDANFRTVTGRNVPVYGIDLDGQVSTLKGKPAPGRCAHDDFIGMNGERGIDNQFFRVVGCSNSYQSTGLSNGWNIEMLTGAWGILITLDGVDDVVNDNDVEVGIFANADPIELSPQREPLTNATYAIDQDPRFQARTKGRIVNGVLTTNPVDVRFHKVTNSIYLERPLNDARLQLTIGKDGTLEGYLAGYTPVEDLYDFQYGFRNGKNAQGGPADPRLIAISSNGQAAVLGHSCSGAYSALHELADANPNPQTGKCESISTQYRIKAISAFVVNTKTRSVNDDLKSK
jgi:hypothetical protein